METKTIVIIVVVIIILFVIVCYVGSIRTNKLGLFSQCNYGGSYMGGTYADTIIPTNGSTGLPGIFALPGRIPIMSLRIPNGWYAYTFDNNYKPIAQYVTNMPCLPDSNAVCVIFTQSSVYPSQSVIDSITHN